MRLIARHVLVGIKPIIRRFLVVIFAASRFFLSLLSQNLLVDKPDNNGDDDGGDMLDSEPGAPLLNVFELNLPDVRLANLEVQNEAALVAVAVVGPDADLDVDFGGDLVALGADHLFFDADVAVLPVQVRLHRDQVVRRGATLHLDVVVDGVRHSLLVLTVPH